MSQEMRKDGAGYIGENDNVGKPMIDGEKDKGYYEKKGLKEKVKEAIVGPSKKEHSYSDKGHLNEAELDKTHHGHGFEKPHDGHVWQDGERDRMKKDIAPKPSGYGYVGEHKKKHFGEKIVGADPLSKELQDKTKDRYDEGVVSHEKSIMPMKTDPLTKEIRAHANKIPHAPTLHDEDIKNKGMYQDDPLCQDVGCKDKGSHKEHGPLHKDDALCKDAGCKDKGLHKEHGILKDDALCKDAGCKDKGLHKEHGILKDDALCKDAGCKDKGLHKEHGILKDDALCKDAGCKDKGLHKEHGPLLLEKDHKGEILSKDAAFKSVGLHKPDPVAHDKEVKQDNLGAVSGQEKEHDGKGHRRQEEWKGDQQFHKEQLGTDGLKDEGLVRDKPYDTTHGEQQKGYLEGAKGAVTHGLEKIKGIFSSSKTTDKGYNWEKVDGEQGRSHWAVRNGERGAKRT